MYVTELLVIYRPAIGLSKIVLSITDLLVIDLSVTDMSNNVLTLSIKSSDTVSWSDVIDSCVL